MRDFELIHAVEDIAPCLLLAESLGLVIREDSPHRSKKPKLVLSKDIPFLKGGSFVLYKREWLFGDLEYSHIAEGINCGKFFVHPRTNYAGLNVYFSGERAENGITRLGSGFFSRDVDWYRVSDDTIQNSPPDIKEVFDKIRGDIDIRKRVHGGVHNYVVLRRAWEKLTLGSAVPPFDFIEWPPRSQQH